MNSRVCIKEIFTNSHADKFTMSETNIKTQDQVDFATYQLNGLGQTSALLSGMISSSVKWTANKTHP